MLRFSSFAGSLSAVMLMTSTALAQVPPDPANPNEAVPEKATYVPYGATIKLDQAKKAADAALAESTKRGWPMCIAVVGPSGDLVYFVKMDDCQYASISIAQHKARASAKYRRPTVVFERLLGRGPFFSYLATLDDVIASRGGNPIVVDGKIIGAIGVSGGTGSQDDLISQAGAASMK
ncbi:MAG TPA: heme-binding protein [Steroidobacteraceae bacterium]|nr:heme-binding protein [Steroidobacteraceae bacterium]